MPIDISVLQDESRYKLLYVLEHKDLVKFVQRYLKQKNPVSLSYTIFNVLILFYAIGKGYHDLHQNWIDFDHILSALGFGFFITFVVAFFIHENIHVLAYKILGAPSATIKAEWRKFVFMALADQFVLNRREFYFLALLPFVVITTVLLLLLGFASTYYSYLLLGILLFHTAGCSGDFALVSYFYATGGAEMYTFDDTKASKTYFYQELNA